MKKTGLSAGRIVLGVFMAIIFFPFFILLPIIGGNTWVFDNKVFDSEVIVEEFEDARGYEKMQEIVSVAVSESSPLDRETTDKIVKDICDEDFIGELIKQLLDKLFEDKDIDLDIENILENSMSKVVSGLFDDVAPQVLDDWISGDINSDYNDIYKACNSLIDDRIIDYVADKSGADKEVLTITQVREYLKVNPISEADKSTILKECEKLVDEYTDAYLTDAVAEASKEIETLIDDMNDSEDIAQVAEVVSMLKQYGTPVIIVCLALFIVLWLLLLLVFKGKRTAFYLPSISLVMSSLVFFAEYIFSVLVLDELSDYISEADAVVEEFVVEIITSFIDGIRNTFLIFGLGAIVIAVVLFIIGTVLHIVRKDNLYKADTV